MFEQIYSDANIIGGTETKIFRLRLMVESKPKTSISKYLLKFHIVIHFKIFKTRISLILK